MWQKIPQSLNVRDISNFKNEERFLLGASSATQTYFFYKKLIPLFERRLSGKMNGVLSSSPVTVVVIHVE